MWHVFIEFGGTLFWALCCLVIALEFAFVSKEKIFLAFGSAMAFFAWMLLFTSFDARGVFIHGWRNVLFVLTAYIGVGTAWAIGRWFIYALKRKNFLQEKLDEFRTSHTTANVEFKFWTLEQKADFLLDFANAWNHDSNHLRGYSYKNRIEICRNMCTGIGIANVTQIVMKTITPLARDEKARITLWISFWPFSIACYLLEDLVVDVCKSIVKCISGFLNGITKSVFSGVNKDMGA